MRRTGKRRWLCVCKHISYHACEQDMGYNGDQLDCRVQPQTSLTKQAALVQGSLSCFRWPWMQDVGCVPNTPAHQRLACMRHWLPLQQEMLISGPVTKKLRPFPAILDQSIPTPCMSGKNRTGGPWHQKLGQGQSWRQTPSLHETPAQHHQGAK